MEDWEEDGIPVQENGEEEEERRAAAEMRAGTEAQYRRRGWRLLDAFLSSDAVPEDVLLHGEGLGHALSLAAPHFPAWMDAERIRRGWSKATWFWLWSAAAFCFRDAGAGDAFAAVRRPEAEFHALPRSRRRTSARKEKRFPPEARKAVQEVLAGMGTPSALLAGIWIEAGTVSGLRPSEWRHAEWTPCPGGARLEVRNGKRNRERGRGNGFKRTLIFTGPAFARAAPAVPLFLQALSAMLARAEASGSSDPFRTVYESARKSLSEAVRRAFGRSGWKGSSRSFTLYSCRHQFAADVKSAGGGRIVRKLCAALMGHASDATACIHYAPRREGEGLPGRTVPGVPPEQKASVRERAGAFDCWARAGRSHGPEAAPSR